MNKNSAIACVIIVLILAHTISSVTAGGADPGESTIWQISVSKITEPLRNGNYRMTNIVAGLTYNPTIYCIPGSTDCHVKAGMQELINKWIMILIPFYSIAILFTGLFFLLKAGTPRGRARARSMFLKLIFGMVLVALGPVIYQAMLESSVMLTNYFWGGSGLGDNPSMNLLFVQVDLESSFFGPGFDGRSRIGEIDDRLKNTGLGFSCIFSVLAAFLILIAGLMVWVRNMMVFYYGIFFPVILFFYSFEVTKPQGRLWLNSALKWIYVPPFQALILSFILVTTDNMLIWDYSSFTMGNITNTLLSNMMMGFLILAGLFGFAFAPMFIGQLMSWVGDVIVATGLGSGRTWMVAAGGILGGAGAGSLVSAGSEMSRLSSVDRYQNSMTPSSTAGSMAALRGSGGVDSGDGQNMASNGVGATSMQSGRGGGSEGRQQSSSSGAVGGQPSSGGTGRRQTSKGQSPANRASGGAGHAGETDGEQMVGGGSGDEVVGGSSSDGRTGGGKVENEPTEEESRSSRLMRGESLGNAGGGFSQKDLDDARGEGQNNEENTDVPGQEAGESEPMIIPGVMSESNITRETAAPTQQMRDGHSDSHTPQKYEQLLRGKGSANQGGGGFSPDDLRNERNDISDQGGAGSAGQRSGEEPQSPLGGQNMQGGARTSGKQQASGAGKNARGIMQAIGEQPMPSTSGEKNAGGDKTPSHETQNTSTQEASGGGTIHPSASHKQPAKGEPKDKSGELDEKAKMELYLKQLAENRRYDKAYGKAAEKEALMKKKAREKEDKKD